MTTQSAPRPVCLASASPRRRELLGLCGLVFEVRLTNIDETPRPAEPPEAYVQRMSREKAEAAAAHIRSQGIERIVIGADTSVVCDGQILGKPADAAEAAAMLRALRGGSHFVLSGVTVLDSGAGESFTELAGTEVRMRDYTDEEISDYIATGDPFDKAGAYAVQHPGFHPTEAMRGCYANVMGLPLCHLTRLLGQVGVPVPVDVAQWCRPEAAPDCFVYRTLLKGDY